MRSIIENVYPWEVSFPAADSESPTKLSEVYFGNEFWSLSNFNLLTSPGQWMRDVIATLNSQYDTTERLIWEIG